WVVKRRRQRGPSPPLLRLLHTELDAELPFGWVAFEHVRRADSGVEPSPQAHALRDEHQVLQLKERFVIGAQRPGKADGRRVFAIEPVSACAPSATDDLIRDVRNDADEAGEPRAPVEQRPRAESLPVVDEQWP